MGKFLDCPYRGPFIPNLLTKKKTATQVCNHPEVRKPCTIEAGIPKMVLLAQLATVQPPNINLDDPIRNCCGCTFWRDSLETIENNLASVEPLDPKQFSPPDPPANSVRRLNQTQRQQLGVSDKATRDLPCVHLRNEELRLVDCATGCVSKLKVFPCEVYGECTIGKPGVGVAGCCAGMNNQGCPSKEVLVPIEKLPLGPKGELIVNCDNHGLGDALIMAWIAEATKEAVEGTPKVILRANGQKRELLRIFGQETVSEGGVNQAQMVSAEFRARFPSRLKFRSEFLIGEAAYKRPVATISQEALEWAVRCIGYKETVLIAPQSAHKEREKPAALWSELAALLDADKQPCLFVGSSPRPEHSQYPGAYGVSPLERQIALYFAAKALVGIDSFPVNLSGTVDLPTVCFLTITTPAVFDHTPSVHCLPREAKAQDAYKKLKAILN